jgi:hypothetical protein
MDSALSIESLRYALSDADINVGNLGLIRTAKIEPSSEKIRNTKARKFKVS